MYKSFEIAIIDATQSLKRLHLALILGWQDVRQKYRRSILGPFWLTISMGIMIGAIGVIFGHLFNSPLSIFLPFLACGIIMWNFIQTVITEACSVFINAENIIKQLPIPLFIHIFRMIWKNILIMLHNLIIFPLLLLFQGKHFSVVNLLFFPGLFLLLINLIWISVVLGLICARYRDMPLIITNLLQVVFYLTPIMWMPNLAPLRATFYIVDLNPLFHFIEIVRAPLLGAVPDSVSWLFLLILAIFGCIFALLIFGAYKKKIVFWL